MRIFNFLKRQHGDTGFITVVSGLPRSGTSMMMQILEAGGITSVTDSIRKPDSDNLKGYYEHELVKALSKGNHDCLINAENCVIKIISTLLKHLPNDRRYKIVFMHRDINEILASQTKMLNNLHSSTNTSNDSELSRLYSQHLESIFAWLNQQKNMEVCHMNYSDILSQPMQKISILATFLKTELDERKMLVTVDSNMRHHTQ